MTTPQTITRTRRPGGFEDVVGQDVVVRTLCNALRTRRVHHAHLFAGPRGVGKTTCARLLARGLNCRMGPTPDPCGACPPCIETITGAALDVLEIDAAAQTGVDNVRETIIRRLGDRPARDRYRVVILDEAHMLSVNAFNALIKTLEEPPPHAVFILATTEPHKVPETVRSRCLNHQFHLIPAETIAERLRRIAENERLHVTPAALAVMARAGRGSLRDAQSVLDQAAAAVAGTAGAIIDEHLAYEALGRGDIRDRLAVAACAIDAIDAADQTAMLRVFTEVARNGGDFREWLKTISDLIHRLLVVQTVGDDPVMLPMTGYERAVVAPRCGRFTTPDLTRLFFLLNQLETDTRETENPRPLIETTLLQLTQTGRLIPLADIRRRLAVLAADACGDIAPQATAQPQLKDADDGARAADGPNRTDPEHLIPRLQAVARNHRRLLTVIHLEAVAAVRRRADGFDFILRNDPEGREAALYFADRNVHFQLRQWLQDLTGTHVALIIRQATEPTTSGGQERGAAKAAT